MPELEFNIPVETLENALAKLDEIIKNLEAATGIIETTEDDIKTELSGEASEEILNTTTNNKLSYLESLSNVFALRSVVQYYYDVVTGEEVYDSSKYIDIDFNVIYAKINELDSIINDQAKVREIIKNTDSFETWVDAYEGTLGDVKWLSKGDKVNSDGEKVADDDVSFFNKDKNEKIFKNNRNILDCMNIDIAGSFTKTNTLVDKLKVEAGILSGQLNNIYDIWNAFEFARQDYVNYAEATGGNADDIEMKLNEKGIIPTTSFSKKGGYFLDGVESGPSEGYIQDTYGVDPENQVPYDVGDGSWTIGPGIALEKDPELTDDQNKQALYDRINDALGLEGDDKYEYPETIPRDVLDDAAAALMNDPSPTNGYYAHTQYMIEQYNAEHDPNLPPLRQSQMDALCTITWKMWNIDDSVFDAIVVSASQTDEEAYTTMYNAFYDLMGDKKRAEETAELFVYADYEYWD